MKRCADNVQGYNRVCDPAQGSYDDITSPHFQQRGMLFSIPQQLDLVSFPRKCPKLQDN
jgi:hypothetical protein